MKNRKTFNQVFDYLYIFIPYQTKTLLTTILFFKKTLKNENFVKRKIL